MKYTTHVPTPQFYVTDEWIPRTQTPPKLTVFCLIKSQTVRTSTIMWIFDMDNNNNKKSTKSRISSWIFHSTTKLRYKAFRSSTSIGIFLTAFYNAVSWPLGWAHRAATVPWTVACASRFISETRRVCQSVQVSRWNWTRMERQQIGF